VKIAFGNAPALIKSHHVKVPIFMVEHAYRLIVTQASLEYCSIRILNFVVAVAQISPAAGHGCENRQKNQTELLHIV